MLLDPGGLSVNPHGGRLGRREVKVTGLAQSTRAAEPTQRGEVSDSTEPIQQAAPVRRAPRGLAPIQGWRGIGWLACGVAGGIAIAWFILLSPGEIGSKAEWFFGAVVFVVVLVAMWLTLTIQRTAKQDAADAAERLRNELTAAEERSKRGLALTQSLHRAEMEAQQKLHDAEIEAQQKLHRAEMDAQQELARTERIHLLKQLQRQAMIEVSRAVSNHTQMLATLWNQGASVLLNEDRDEREQAMNPIFERISQVVNDFSVELDNAHLLIEDDRLHHALNRVNEAALMAIRVAEDVHIAVVEGHAPEPNPIPPVQRLMHARAAEARRLAWDLLRTGLDVTGASG
jgi:hypothetical protein